MSAEVLLAFHAGVNLAIQRWAWMIRALMATDSIVAYSAALALMDIQPDANYVLIAAKASTAGAGR